MSILLLLLLLDPVDAAAASVDGLFSQSWLMLSFDRAAAAKFVKRTIMAIQVIAILFDAKPLDSRRKYTIAVTVTVTVTLVAILVDAKPCRANVLLLLICRKSIIAIQCCC